MDRVPGQPGLWAVQYVVSMHVWDGRLVAHGHEGMCHDKLLPREVQMGVYDDSQAQ